MRKKRNKRLKAKNILIVAIFALLIYLFIHPIQLLQNNLFKPISIAEGNGMNGQNIENRYSQNLANTEIYKGFNDHEFNIEFNRDSLKNDTQLLSYESVLTHRDSTIFKDSNGNVLSAKDVLIADMKNVDNLTDQNFKKRYFNQFPRMYRENNQEKIDRINEEAKYDSTINQNEINSEIWERLGLEIRVQEQDYVEIYNQEAPSQFSLAIEGDGMYGTEGNIITKTRSLCIYNTIKNATLLSTANGLDLGEAYLMALQRSSSNSYDVDRIQQALWLVKNNTDEIPSKYIGINPESTRTAKAYADEAKSLNKYISNLKSLKESKIYQLNQSNKEYEPIKEENSEALKQINQEIIDNNLIHYEEKKDEKGDITFSGYVKEDKYENGTAGVVGYNEDSKEYLVGPFSINYLRNIYIPKSAEEGGQSETLNKDGIILFNSIVDSEIYGIDGDGNEVKLDDWEFDFVNLTERDGKLKRTAQIEAESTGDTTLNIYPYPNELFYIKFKNPNVYAITKLEFKLSSMSAQAEVYLLQGRYYDVSWKSAKRNNSEYLQMSPTWKEIYNDFNSNNYRLSGAVAPDLYQVKSAKIINEQKIIQLNVGTKHVVKNVINKPNSDKNNEIYCIPITMKFAGNVWVDGAELNEDRANGKIDNGEAAVKDAHIYVYDSSNNLIQTQNTNDKGYYKFDYIKLGPKYYLEFEYDGMKYKSTKYMTSWEQNRYATDFMDYLDRSHVKEDEIDRNNFNNQFVEIKNGDARNTGQAISDKRAIKSIQYYNHDFVGEYIGSKAEIYRYDIVARTKTANLYYPLQNSYIITNKKIDENQENLDKRNLKNVFVLGTLSNNENYIFASKQGEVNSDLNLEQNMLEIKTVNYTMADEYLQHINLGLIERSPIDLAVKCDLEKTIITECEKDPYPISYGSKSNLYDIENRGNRKDSDYYSSSYNQEIAYTPYTWQYYFTNNPKSQEQDDTQLYLQYKMTVKNQSEIVSGYVTELVNYYEDDLYYPVDSNETWKYYDESYDYVTDSNKTGKGYADLVIPKLPDKTSWAVKYNADGTKTELGQITWNADSTFGRDNNKNLKNSGLNTMYTNSLADLKLEKDETIDIYVIYKTKRDKNSTYGAGKYMSLKSKRNILEINSYKALNKDNTPGGRVDIDSAPGNSEIGDYKTYEDDADMAPIFNITVGRKEDSKSIVGHVWEDSRIGNFGLKLGNNQIIGNGRIDDKESYIDNVKAQLIRLEYDKQLNKYVEVEFTEKYVEAYISGNPVNEGKTIVETNDGNNIENKDKANTLCSIVYYTGNGGAKGQYTFNNLMESGKYKVRFVYGTEKQLEKEITLKDATMYSGHDYKSTMYNGGEVEPSSEHQNPEANAVSSAKDYLQNESYYTMAGNLVNVSGRLEVMKYSQEMNPEIADVLNVEYMQETKDKNKLVELANNTKMTADSYLVNFDFYDGFRETKLLNLGLEEIPKRTVEVTNEVNNILVKLANGRKIIDLSVDINKNVQEITDKLFSVYMDEEIMQGATVEVTYKINVSNIGEVDSLYTYAQYATDAEKRQWYYALTGENVSDKLNIDDVLLRSIPTKVTKLYSYYDNLIFRAEDNNRWEIINKTVKTPADNNLKVERDSFGKLVYVNEDSVYTSRSNLRKERNVWEKIDQGKEEVLNRIKTLEENAERFKNVFTVETTSFKDIELYPNASKEVIDNLKTTTLERPVSTICTYLTLSKTLAADDVDGNDALNYRNTVEIIETSSVNGRRDYNGKEGTFNGDLKNKSTESGVDATDTDEAERVTILPPFGRRQLLVGIIIAELVIIAGGIVFLKKRNKNRK